MAKILRAPINIKILEWALQDVNLSEAEFAEKAKVKPEMVTAWLDGTIEPTYNQLEDIAYRILKLPLAAFFLPEPPKNLSVKKKFRSLPDYLYEATSYKTRIAIKKADFYKTALIELFGTNPSQEPIFNRIKLSSNQNSVKTAQLIREEFGISIELQKSFRNGYEAFNYYRENLERKGIYLFQLQLEGDRGFCLLDNEFPIIVVNSSDSINSKIFTLFHELIHILTDTDDIYKEIGFAPYLKSDNEVFSNRTASEILVPLNEVKKRYGESLLNWDEDLISNIAREYSVSKEVILLKIVSMDYATQDDYQRLKNNWDEEFRASQKARTGGSYYVNKISALGRQYISGVIDSYKLGRINDVQVSNYLDIKFTNLARIESEVFA